jgi:hypothetical protein
LVCFAKLFKFDARPPVRTRRDKPLSADFDGDSRTDYAVFRPSDGIWYIFNSRTASLSAYQFGEPTDALIPADYDGDGKADVARVPHR